MSWEENRKHWALYKNAEGFYTALPIGWGDDYVEGPIDYEDAVNMANQLYEVRRFLGPECNRLSLEQMLDAYDKCVYNKYFEPVKHFNGE